LRVQRAFFPEGHGLPHVYLLHPPGGLVPGDRLSINVHSEAEAHALVTTPAAGKCYRSDGRRAHQEVLLRVDAGASLEWLPQENIVFNGALVHLDTRVDLAVGATFVGWNLLCLGRPASSAPFEQGLCTERFTLWCEGVPLFIERAVYDSASALRHGAWGLAGHAATGSMVVYPATPAMLDRAREIEVDAGARPRLAAGATAGLFGSTLLANGVLCCRYLGDDVGDAREHFGQVWAALRPELLGRAAIRPRIWAT
jgi:urease accessory protein